MKRLKDFIYDTNDIIIAFLVLFLAAIIIIWRMNVILDYPKVLLGTDTEGDDSSVTSEIDEDTSLAQMPSDVSDSSSEDSESEDTSTTETQTVEVASTLVETSVSSVSWDEDGCLLSDVTVDIHGSSATEAVSCLVDKGIFTDYAEYKSICQENGLKPEKVSAGTFTFAAGTTKAEITKKINWS